jgi:AAA15 family ATPase/GTPase
MLNEVWIRNFKGFEKLTIPELGRITLIGGRNNIGKTALLESLFLFLDRYHADMILRQYKWRGIEGILSDPNIMWAPIFYNFDINKEIVIGALINGEQQEAKFKFNPNFKPQTLSPIMPPSKREIPTEEKGFAPFSLDIEYTSDGKKEQMSHLTIDQTGRLMLQLDNPPSTTPPGVFLASKQHAPTNDTNNWLSSFIKEGRENECVEFLRIIEPRLNALKLIAEGPSSFVHGMLEGATRTRDIHLMGEGMEKLLNLTLAIARSKGGCVFQDEFENGLHYSTLSKIWEAVAGALHKYDCQLITTTHSNECLRACFEGLANFQDDFRYIRLDRRDEEITAKLFNYKMMGEAINTSLEVR